MRSELRISHEGVNPSVLKNVADLIWLQEIVDRDGDGAGLKNSQQGGREFGTVFEPKANAIAGPDVEWGSQLCGHKPDLVPDFPVRKFALPPVESGFGFVLLRGDREGGGQIH